MKLKQAVISRTLANTVTRLRIRHLKPTQMELQSTCTGESVWPRHETVTWISLLLNCHFRRLTTDSCLSTHTQKKDLEISLDMPKAVHMIFGPKQCFIYFLVHNTTTNRPTYSIERMMQIHLIHSLISVI